MINFYRDMWKKRSELLAPLTALTSKNVKYDWKEKHQKYFDAIKGVIGREVFLAYPDFNRQIMKKMAAKITITQEEVSID